MADGPANKTAPAEVVTAALNKPTPGFAGMKMKLGDVPTSTALFADGEKNHKEPTLPVSAAVFFPELSAKGLGDSAAVQTANLELVLDRFRHWVLMERVLMMWRWIWVLRMCLLNLFHLPLFLHMV